MPTKSWKNHPQKLLRKTQIHFFPYCPELPKWRKKKNSCSKMWLIGQLGLIYNFGAQHKILIKGNSEGKHLKVEWWIDLGEWFITAYFGGPSPTIFCMHSAIKIIWFVLISNAPKCSTHHSDALYFYLSKVVFILPKLKTL